MRSCRRQAHHRSASPSGERHRQPTTQSPAAITPRATDVPTDVGHVVSTDLTKIVPKGLRSFGPEDADFFLELLPGPRGRDGLPTAVGFWKSRIENIDAGKTDTGETDASKTFSVGLMYGPSGCGKSSLVKAGLLPRLDDRVLRLYLEATHDVALRLAAPLPATAGRAVAHRLAGRVASGPVPAGGNEGCDPPRSV